MYRPPLVLVTGPSGSGKDSLIAAAQRRLAGDRRFVFARRVITRPATPGGEAHVPVDAERFEHMRAAGRFALCWEAYGRHYGIGREIADDLAAGRCVVANVSRAIVPAARARFAPVLAVALEVPPAVLAGRIAARAREDEAEAAARLARSGLVVEGEVVRLRNDGALETCVDAFLRILLAHAAVGDAAAD